MSSTREAVVVCEPGGGDPLRVVAGLTLLERLLRQLSAIDSIDSITVIAPREFRFPTAYSRVGCPVKHRAYDGAGGWEMASAALESRDTDARVLVVAANLLVDQRLIQWLAAATSNVLISPSAGAPAAILGNLDSRGAEELAAGDAGVSSVRPLESFDTYVRHQRGDVALHLLPVVSDADVERVWAILFDHVEKRTKDLPATYFDPPFENFLVRVIAPTAITPNQITFATGALGFFVAWLFLHGWLFSGVLLAICVEVLDGVDGKLARVKLMTSKLGKLEHVLDFFYENSWYLSLGAYFASTGVAWAWPAAWVICAADIADNLSYVYYARRVGGSAWRDYVPSLDDANRFLRTFRLVAGRRNIYVWLMLPGFALGAAPAVFALAVAWSAITAATHWAVGHLISRVRPATQPQVPPAHPAGAHADTRTLPFPVRSRRADSSAPQYRP
jgi:phosphatidylglycerophosphate synthase